MSAAAVSSRGQRVRIALAAAALLGVGAATLGVVRASRVGRAVTHDALGPFRVGEEVRSRARVTVRLDLGRGAPPQEMELEGEWRTTVTEVGDGLARVACELADLRATAREGSADSARAADAGPELAREIGRRFFVSQRADGSVFEVWLPRGMKPAMANILLTLAGEAQLVRPPQAQPAWIIEERDVNGAYLAAYQETAPGRFHKQKARYLEAVAAAQAAPATAAPGQPNAGANVRPNVRIDHSDIDLVADARGRLLELRADDTTTLEVAGISFTVSLRFTLDGRARSPRPPSRAPSPTNASTSNRTRWRRSGLDPEAEAARRDRALLAGASADDLIAELRALPADEAGSRSRAASTVLARWEALLHLEPATAARLPALVRGESAPRGKLLVDALSAAGTEPAQAALAGVAADPAARAALRVYAVQYLGLQRSPAPSAVAGLRALIDDRDPDLAQAALLALGACARSLRATAPERTREIVAELLARLGRATAAKSRQDVVVALGNAGDPGSLAALRGLIQDTGGALRTPAIEALRFIDDPAVDTLLGSLLGRTGDSSARFAAISALRFRDVGPFTVQLADVARHDPVQHLRGAAIDLLGSRLGDLPALRPLLEEVAHRDPNAATASWLRATSPAADRLRRRRHVRDREADASGAAARLDEDAGLQHAAPGSGLRRPTP